MDSTHIHLLLNHFPIIGTIIGTAILLFGIWNRNIPIQQISLTTISIMALLAIPVFLTGEPAEESVENLPGISENVIEAHEEAAEIAFWLMMVTGVVSILSLVAYNAQHQYTKVIVRIAVGLSLLTSGTMIRTGYLGGQIRHTEISNAAPSDQPVEKGAENEDD